MAHRQCPPARLHQVSKTTLADDNRGWAVYFRDIFQCKLRVSISYHDDLRKNQNYNLDSPGRLSNGTAPAIIVMPPFKRPELPIPAIALPPISMDEELASPQMRDPSSKRPKKMRYDHCPFVRCQPSCFLDPPSTWGFTDLGAVIGVYLSRQGL